MKKTIYSSDGKLKCSSCGNYHYQWWMISHKKKLSQRKGCSSMMMYNATNECYEIHSYYGSEFDTSIFKVVRTLFPTKKVFSINNLLFKLIKMKIILFVTNVSKDLSKRS